jgi:L-ascorbate metabolism protein UlaG (beta-lactamase superfamily)
MEIKWYGLGCFRLSEDGLPPVVLDPFDESETGLPLPKDPAGIVVSTRLIDKPELVGWDNLRGVSRTIAGPGEYEIGGVFITGVASSRERSKNEASKGHEGRGSNVNVIYTVDMQGVTVAHLGEIERAPTQSEVEALGRVNVLLVPVGVQGGMTPAKASEAVSLIEPDIVVPMQYQIPNLKLQRKSVSGFLKEMGLGQSNPLDRLRLSASSIPEDLQIVLLDPQDA